MKSSLSFDYNKATQSINYLLSRRVNKKMNKMKAIKLIWAADRYHLRNYGRTITGDTYFAMKLGPVASGTLDIADSSQVFEKEEKTYSQSFIETVGHDIKSINDPDLDIFSDSEIEALNFAFDTFEQFPEFKLAKEITHKYPEWEKFKKGFDAGISTREYMDLSDFFSDPSNEDDNQFVTDPALLESSKQEFINSRKLIEALYA